MAKWRKEGIFVKPQFRFVCQGCKDPDATFTETGHALNEFPLYDDDYDYQSHALDRTYICDLCGFRVVFGLAITKEHYEAITEWKKEKKKPQGSLSERVNKLLWTPNERL